MPPQPHDALVRRIFSDPAHARDELQAHLPAALVAAVDWSRLEVVSGVSYVDDDLRERVVDLLYGLPFLDGSTEAKVYVLFEHQSTVDPRMAARLLVYMARIWDHWMREHPGTESLPLVIPLLLHHSASGWTATRDFGELLHIPPELESALAAHIPRFTFLLDDISKLSDGELHARAQSATARLALWILQNARREAVPAQLRRWARLAAEVLAEPQGTRALKAIFSYLGEVRDDDFIDIFAKESHSPRIEKLAMNHNQRIREEGREEGRQEGREEGREEGRQEAAAAILAKLLQLKFGTSADERLSEASAQELELWSARILTAESLDEVFALD